MRSVSSGICRLRGVVVVVVLELCGCGGCSSICRLLGVVVMVVVVVVVVVVV